LHAEIGILGGGVTGLSLASFLTAPAEVLEKNGEVGGLARTFGRNGFLSDIGGHIVFSKDKAALDAMVAALDDNVAQRRRNNRVLYEGTYVKYPFENDLAALPKEAAYDCLIHFIKNDAKPPPHANFQEWMFYTFGRGITERYLLPYNRKIWKLDPTLIGTEWVDRIPRPPIEDVVKSALGIATEGYTHQLHFFYPKENGIVSLPRAFAREVKERQSLVLDYGVETVRKTDRGWIVNGEREYRELVSTIPLRHLLDALPDVPSQVRDAALALRFNALRVVLFGVGRREGLDEMTAAYIPDESVLPHRVCFNCAFSPNMAPPGCASVTCEITTRPGDGIHELSDDALAERTLRDIVSLGILRADDTIVERVVWREPMAYVVYDGPYAKNQTIILDFLESVGIHAAGRFGEHKYVNMDACIRRSLDLAAQLEGTRR